jgi:hypothetical protein
MFIMKKETLFPLAATAGGIVAFLLRFLQNRTGFEATTGLPIPGNIPGIILVLFLILMAAGLFVLSRKLPAPEAEDFPTLFTSDNKSALFLPVIGILLIALSGLADLYEYLTLNNLLVQLKSAADPYGVVVENSVKCFTPASQLILGAVSILAAGALFLTIADCRKQDDSKPFNGIYLLFPPVALVVRLVFTYRLESINPSLESYYTELLALMLLTLAFYMLSSFAFNVGNFRRFAFFVGLSLVFVFPSLADGGPHLSSLLLYAGSAATLMGFLMLRFSGSVESTEEDS